MPNDCFRVTCSVTLGFFFVAIVTLWPLLDTRLDLWTSVSFIVLLILRGLCFSLRRSPTPPFHRLLLVLFVVITCFLVCWTLLGSFWYETFTSSPNCTLTRVTKLELSACFLICDVVCLACGGFILDQTATNLSDYDVWIWTGSRTEVEESDGGSRDVGEVLKGLGKVYEGTGEEGCVICCEGLSEKTVKLPKCGHEFHEGCIVEWAKRKPICPYCRESISVSNSSEVGSS